MKILYEPKDSIINQDDFLEMIIKDLDKINDEELRPLMKIIMEQYRALNYKLNIANNEIRVLKTQWALRKIEDQINSEGGTITLLKDGIRFKLSGFSHEVANLISQSLMER